MMSNKQKNNFFAVDIQFTLGYRPFFIMVVLIQAFHSKKIFYLKTHHPVSLVDGHYIEVWRGHFLPPIPLLPD